MAPPFTGGAPEASDVAGGVLALLHMHHPQSSLDPAMLLLPLGTTAQHLGVAQLAGSSTSPEMGAEECDNAQEAGENSNAYDVPPRKTVGGPRAPKRQAPLLTMLRAPYISNAR